LGGGREGNKREMTRKTLASKPRSMFEPHAPCLSVLLLANGLR